MKAKALLTREITHPDLLVKRKTGEIDEQATARNIATLMARYSAREISPQEYKDRFRLVVEKGHVIEHPLAYMLVGLGFEPVDEECKKAAAEWGLLQQIDSNNEALIRLERSQGTGDRKFDLSNAAADRRQKTRTEKLADRRERQAQNTATAAAK
ncbi:MAG: hypothetical protein ACYTGL_13840 [Planctomycetota bacterium]|jgi:hypothetical protein